MGPSLVKRNRGFFDNRLRVLATIHYIMANYVDYSCFYRRTHTMKIILASSSPYRKQLLQRVISEFDCASPEIQEHSLENETPHALAERLAIEKAKALQAHYPNALIIGSDQVAWLDNKQLHKPGNRENNIHQLEQCSGKSVFFYTGLCLLNSQSNQYQSCVEQYETRFRTLNHHQISNYVDREKAYDCAGGFKMEGLGISLFERIRGDDPNVLIGLPLIKLIDMLNSEGFDVLTPKD